MISKFLQLSFCDSLVIGYEFIIFILCRYSQQGLSWFLPCNSFTGSAPSRKLLPLSSSPSPGSLLWNCPGASETRRPLVRRCSLMVTGAGLWVVPRKRQRCCIAHGEGEHNHEALYYLREKIASVHPASSPRDKLEKWFFLLQGCTRLVPSFRSESWTQVEPRRPQQGLGVLPYLSSPHWLTEKSFCHLSEESVKLRPGA